eukprot:1333697-Amorphochlora_amoeboformis.AAC.1
MLDIPFLLSYGHVSCRMEPPRRPPPGQWCYNQDGKWHEFDAKSADVLDRASNVLEETEWLELVRRRGESCNRGEARVNEGYAVIRIGQGGARFGLGEERRLGKKRGLGLDFGLSMCGYGEG